MLCNFKNIIPGLEIYGKENYSKIYSIHIKFKAMKDLSGFYSTLSYTHSHYCSHYNELGFSMSPQTFQVLIADGNGVELLPSNKRFLCSVDQW